MAEKKSSSDAEERSPETTVVDAVRHVGRTLESESDKVYTPVEARSSAEFENEVGMRVANDLEDADGRGPKDVEAGEPLVTRLAGDTSSDPHTDTVADNATTVKRRKGV